MFKNLLALVTSKQTCGTLKTQQKHIFEIACIYIYTYILYNIHILYTYIYSVNNSVLDANLALVTGDIGWYHEHYTETNVFFFLWDLIDLFTKWCCLIHTITVKEVKLKIDNVYKCIYVDWILIIWYHINLIIKF